MAVDQSSGAFAPDSTQLTSVRVPLDQAADAFVSPDASGRTPIVMLTRRQNRIGNVSLLIGVVILVGGILWGILAGNFLLIGPAIVLSLVFFVLAVFRSFLVRIPEGANGLLQQRGKYLRTIESGTLVLPPWIVVSHLVTRRIIPFDVPVQEAPTQDNVRASVQALVTFTISDPYHFVYSVSASDFDQVFQAACQNTMRAMVRQISSDEVNNLPRQDTSELRETLSNASEPYGVKIVKVTILYARPPEDFVRSQEARQLAILQRAEQMEQQALVQRKQTDAETLARQAVIARVDREHEELQLQIQQAEARRLVVELEAEAEELRLAKLQDRLHRYPQAAEWEWQGEQLQVARGLASNTRAVVQLGNGGANDIARAFLMREVMQGKDAQVNTYTATPTS
ncbi:MAG: SPFH domain-containing protein [Chloroflexi bacterium]|nr:MAG: SPFH domain-containing protein [Chloroflexota bacterium]